MITVTAVLTHWGLINIGHHLLHSDFAPSWLFSDDVRAGRWTAFQYQMSYAGVGLTYLRALWMSFYEGLMGWDYFRGQSIFSYIWSPVLITWGAYFVSRSYLKSRIAALISGILAACGLQFWIDQYANDTYVAYLFLGCILLGMRARVINPWTDWNGWRLVVAGILSGFAVYTSRISLIFLMSVWVPWTEIGPALQELWKMRTGRRWQQTLFGLGCLFFSLFAYLEALGPSIGHWGGREIKIHATPNLKFALFCWFITLAPHYWNQLKGERLISLVKNLAVFTGAFCIGFLPEIIHVWNTHVFSEGTQGNRNFSDFLVVLAGLHRAIHSLLTASPDDSLQRIPALILLFGSVLLIRQSRKNAYLLPLIASAILTIFAFCRVHNYAGPEPRYLIPLFPWIWVAWGSAVEWTLQKNRLLWATLLGALLVYQFAFHASAKRQLILDTLRENRFDQKMAIIEKFRAENIRVVISDDYWNSNEYSVFSRGNPWFVPAKMQHLTPPQAIDLSHSEKRIGWMTSQPLHPSMEIEKNLGTWFGKNIYIKN